jgi:hypothetical protein
LYLSNTCIVGSNLPRCICIYSVCVLSCVVKTSCVG